MSDHTLSSSMPNADENDLPTKLNAHIHAALLDDMMPGVMASDERDTRRFQANKRRLAGIALTVDEIHHDLIDILSQLTTRLLHHEQGVSSLLKTPAQAINYVERTTAYAIKDYPRDFDANKDIAGLWDILEVIHTESYDWRQGDRKHDGEILIATIKNIIVETLNPVYPDMGDTAEEYNSIDESSNSHAHEGLSSTSVLPDTLNQEEMITEISSNETSEDVEIETFLSDTSLDEADNTSSYISSEGISKKAAHSTSLPPDYNPFDLDW